LEIFCGVLLGLGCQSRITSTMCQLHLLPIKYHIVFKITTLMHWIIHGCCLPYFVKLVYVHTYNQSVI